MCYRDRRPLREATGSARSGWRFILFWATLVWVAAGGAQPSHAQGVFGPVFSVEAEMNRTSPPVTGDFNGDGNLDIAVGQSPIDPGFSPQLYTNSYIGVILGNGNGTFRSVERIFAKNPVFLKSVDYDGDGITDLIFKNAHRKELYIWYGQSGNITSPPSFREQFVEIPVVSDQFELADLNHDGKMDLAFLEVRSYTTLNEAQTEVETHTDIEIKPFFGGGEGLFLAGKSYTVAGNLGSVYFRIHDFSRDGHPDLFIGIGDGPDHTGNVEILNGKGDGTFNPPVRYPIQPDGSGLESTSFILGDFNGDGWLDLTGLRNEEDATTGKHYYHFLSKGTPGGGFGPSYDLSEGFKGLMRVSADFNGDGRADMITANFFGREPFGIGVLWGSDQNPLSVEVKQPLGHYGLFGTAADFNRDRKPDLAFYDDSPEAGHNISVILNRSDQFRPGDVNADGRVTIQDAILILGAVAGARPIEAQERAVADVTGGDGVTVQDVVMVLRFVTGLIDRFPTTP